MGNETETSLPIERTMGQETVATRLSSNKVTQPTRLRAGLRQVFSLDLRALAALRMSSALLSLASLADRLRDFTAFYTNAGVLDESIVWRGARFEPWDGASYLQPSRWLPDPWSSVALFAVAAVAAIYLLLGRQARKAGFLAWLTLTAIDNRNPLVLNSGDDLLRLLLFWGLFLPLSERWSVDAGSPLSARPNRVVSVGTAAFLVQLALVYLMSALFKSYADWAGDRSALHYAFHLEQFVTPLGAILRDYLPTRLLSQATWSLELVGPLLLFSPLATDRLRTLLFYAFVLMHVGIGLTLGLGLFSAVCIAAWVATLPTTFWDRLDGSIKSVSGRDSLREFDRTAGDHFASNLFAGFFLGYVLLWNVWSLNPGTHEAWFPFAARWLGYQLRIAQLWGMFSPSPAKVSSWLELKAETDDGRVFWLRPDGRVCDRKPVTPERILSERWRKFHERVIQHQTSDSARRYANFLRGRFERSFPGTPARVTVVWVRKASPPPNVSDDPKQSEQVKLLATAAEGAI